MNDALDRRASRAAAAVRERTNDLPADDMEAVRRRARRPAASTVVAVLLIAALGVPVGVWLLGGSEGLIELEPADAPTDSSSEPNPPTPLPAESGPPDPDAAATPGPREEPDATEPTPAVEPVSEFGTEQRSTEDFPYDGEGFAQLVDVRVATHEGFDRIVLEFDTDAIPSYRVGYVDPPVVQDGSGEEMAIDGEAFLEIRMTPASGLTPLTDPPGDWERTYEGPLRLRLGSGTVTEVVRVDDWEANLSWVVGVERTAPFSMEWLSGPRRLVVDVAHR